MKLISVLVFALAAVATPAAAQSVPSSWQGAYLGIGGGGQSFNGTAHSLTTGNTHSLSGQNAQAGLYGGYNWTAGPWLYGIEADWSHTFADTNDFDMFSARGRIGYMFANVLIYGTAGVATENRFLNITKTNGIITQALTSEAQHTGFIAGGGFETVISRELSLRVEGLYFAGGSEQYGFAFAAPLLPSTWNRDFDQVIYRAGLTYHFN